ncbi:hypothetical protein NHX12_007826 [Muraenolepis orangiensis]|uniref:AAA+ ATPase domain-containing protein n=1 Tax=Muraenolepis orangiensis TaxID=630683 RepID=A0A9Q0DNL2_9TELE|nr:hypothetical protein NHX12_007826 [Muraenolepis orangiensis]
MQWSPEHSQWAEQHFDISSTTRSPAHKAEAYRGHFQRSYQYSWANDDISALTASNLLKKYAEKYSGLLEGPSERHLLCSYSDSAADGRKSENEAWHEAVFPIGCPPDAVSVSKATMAAALPPTEVCASMGSPGGALPEPGYSVSSLPSQEYPGSYSGSYLHSGYSGQTAPILPSPHPSPLQPPPAPPTPAPGAGYTAGSPSLSGYGYPPPGYPHPTVPGYTSPSAYLASPPTLPPYPYQAHHQTALTPTPLTGSTANSFKRKAFYMSDHGDTDSSYGHFSYGQQRSSQSPMFRLPDSSGPDSGRIDGFHTSTEASSLLPTKQPVASERKCNVSSGGALSPPSYGPTEGSGRDLRSGESYGKLCSAIVSEQSEKRPAHRLADAEDQLKDSEAGLVDTVTAEVLQQGPPVDWSDIAGLDEAKAAIKEEILWPLLRPDMFSGLSSLPRSLLLFGPRGSGRTLLARCMADQLGAAFLCLDGSALVTERLGEADRIVRASFLVARCRQPAVVFISDVDLLGPAQRLKAELLLQLDAVLSSPADRVLVVCSSDKPEDIPEPLRRRFARRLLVPPPDAGARRQIIGRLLGHRGSQVGEEEAALLVRRTEGFSGLDLARLCQEALLGSVGPCLSSLSSLDLGVSSLGPGVSLRGLGQSSLDFGLSSLHGGQPRAVSYQDFDKVFCKFRPSVTQKELDMFTDWNKMFGCSQ